MEKKQLQQLIIEHALDDIDIGGWNNNSLMSGTENAGLNKADLYHAFPKGAQDAIKFYSQMLDNKMIEQLESEDLSVMKIRDKITHAVKTRILLIEPHKRAEQAAVKFYMNPINFKAGLQSMYKTVDAMWYMAGDKSTDYNFYTKRLILSGVYGSTLKYWLKDESENYENTWMFLDRRIENVMNFEKFKKSFKDKFQKFPFFNKNKSE